MCISYKHLTTSDYKLHASQVGGALTMYIRTHHIHYAEGGATEVYCNRAVCPSVCYKCFLVAR